MLPHLKFMGYERLTGLLFKSSRIESSFSDTKNMKELFIRKGVYVCDCWGWGIGRGREQAGI